MTASGLSEQDDHRPVAGMIRVQSGGGGTIDSHIDHLHVTDLIAKTGQGRVKPRRGPDPKIDRQCEQRPRCRHSQDWPKRLWPDMAMGECAGTYHAVVAARQGQGSRDIGLDQITVHLLFARLIQHLRRKVDPVDLSRPAKPAQGCPHKPRPGPHIQHRPRPACSHKGPGHMGGQSIIHLCRKARVIAFGPVAIQAQAILWRSKGKGGMKIRFGHGTSGTQQGWKINPVPLARRRCAADSHAMTGTLLSLGHGYSASALARRLRPQGWRIIGTTRNPEKADRLRAEGVEPLLWPCDLAPALAESTHLLSSIAPDETGDPVLVSHRADIAAAPLRWVGYLSTTGVYGDHQGGWVDESTPLTPSTQRGLQRVRAEAEWQSLGLPLHIFRIAGIYGPGRGPFEKVRDGTARRILKPGQVFSRIHVDDIAQVLEASITRPCPGAIYNLCDDDPAPPEDVIGHAATLLGLPLPPAVPYEKAEMTPMARSFYAESKRVRNDRIKTELGVQLIHPDYRAGLNALLRDETK